MVSALDAFYASQDSIKSSRASLLQTSLLTLYDTLNDDDDEIRDFGAKIVCRILRLNLVPLAAGPKFLAWLSNILHDNEDYGFHIVQRLTGPFKKVDDFIVGPLTPVQTMLSEALVDDDSLFIEEEQNLYIDEVRDAIAYSDLIATKEGPGWNRAIRCLEIWATESVSTLVKLVEAEDGPLGMTSKPRVFAICMNVILASKALLFRIRSKVSSGAGNEPNPVQGSENLKENRDGSEVGVIQDLEAAVNSLLVIGTRNNLHPLLLEVLQDNGSVHII
jgi:hypothetical protein